MRVIRTSTEVIIRGDNNIPMRITRAKDVIKLQSLVSSYIWQAKVSDDEGLCDLAEVAASVMYPSIDTNNVHEIYNLMLSVQEPI